MSKTFLPMMLSVFASVAVYYLLATRTPLSENLSMAAGVTVGVIGAVTVTRIFKRK